MKIYIESEIIRNRNISDSGVAVAVALMTILKKGRENNLVSLKLLAHVLTDQTEINRYFAAELQTGIADLETAGYIKILSKVGKSEYLLDLRDLCFENANSYFVVTEDSTLPKIFSCECDRKRLLRYYLALLSSVMNKNGYNMFLKVDVKKNVGYMPQSYFIEQLSISQRSLYTYTALLEELQLIYVHRQDKLMAINGQLRSFSNIYGRYEDKDVIAAAGTALSEEYHAATFKKQMDKDLKHLAGKFRYIRDSGKVYDDETMELIYLAMVEQNKKNRAKYFTDDLYQKYKKNLSVFQPYPFYKGDDGLGCTMNNATPDEPHAINEQEDI